MRIENRDGTARFDLKVEGYQFPEVEHDEWDSNWLVVSGNVVTGSKSWQFIHPCLLTMEAHELANWLGDVAGGRQTKERIHFTEPNLSFEVVSCTPETVDLRLYFSLEALPPKVDADYEDYFELFHVSRVGLETAAAALCRSLQRFPVRAEARRWAPWCRES